MFRLALDSSYDIELRVGREEDEGFGLGSLLETICVRIGIQARRMLFGGNVFDPA